MDLQNLYTSSPLVSHLARYLQNLPATEVVRFLKGIPNSVFDTVMTEIESIVLGAETVTNAEVLLVVEWKSRDGLWAYETKIENDTLWFRVETMKMGWLPLVGLCVPDEEDLKMIERVNDALRVSNDTELSGRVDMVMSFTKQPST